MGRGDRGSSPKGVEPTPLADLGSAGDAPGVVGTKRVPAVSSFDPGRSKRVAVDEDSEVFENPDGTVSEVLSAGPQRFRSGDGWVEYDFSLTADGSGGFVPAASDVGVSFGGGSGLVGLDAGDGSLVRVGVPSGDPSVKAGVAPVDLSLGDGGGLFGAEGTVASSRGVSGGVSARVSPTASGAVFEWYAASRGEIGADGSVVFPVELPAGWV